jgi:cephalosporin hydroxylase
MRYLIMFRKEQAMGTIYQSIKAFEEEKKHNIEKLGKSSEIARQSLEWMQNTADYKYTYNFTWLGRPIIQIPQDIVAMQEILWKVKPDLIIETGIAHGGSLILSASMLALMDYEEALLCGGVLDPSKSKRLVLGIDIDIRAHNRAAIEAHPLSRYIKMLEGSSVAPDVAAQVYACAEKYNRIMVCLDSSHTHDHVLAELQAYAHLTTKGSYCIVFDTLVEDMPEDLYANRLWGKGNNPKTAVREFLKTCDRFVVDKHIESKLLLTVAPDGYLYCVKD